MENTVFTPSALLNILLQIDELSDYTIDVSESLDGSLRIVIGDSIYEIPSHDAEVIQTDNSTVEQIEQIDSEAYEEIVDSGTADYLDSVNTGLIKEIVKTLFVGGMVRLAAKQLRK